MKFVHYKTLIAPLLCAGSTASIFAGTIDIPTPTPMPTQVQPQLNVAIDKDTEEVTFVNTNNDPYVYTKVYKLKYADPYELRPFIMEAVRSRRVDANVTKVEAIKYADGTGMLIVSAEQYRFEGVTNGMSLDDIITMLDRPELASETGRKFFLYFPKYFDAVTLKGLIEKVGMQRPDDPVELEGGIDTVAADAKLNALMFYCAPASEKYIRDILAQYDGPTTEAVVSYSIYEIETENDGNLGVDFQAWKNGPGADIFAAGARYVNGWNVMNHSVDSLIKPSHTSFINFNPKWNSRYLDFLVSKSKAHVITKGVLSIGNSIEASIESVTRMPVITEGEDTAGTASNIAEAFITQSVSDGADMSNLGYNQDNLRPVSMVTTSTATFNATRTKVGNKTYYTLHCSVGGYFVTADGKNLGRTARVLDCSPAYQGEALEWITAGGYAIEKDKTRVTRNTEYGFKLTMTPFVYDKCTNIQIAMENTNLIGFKSNGLPRSSKTDLKTEVQVSNDNATFYIGGLEKSALVKSVSKMPFLGDIPFLGFLFSAESETVKKTEIVAVLNIRPVLPDTVAPKSVRDEAESVRKKISGDGLKKEFLDENSYGFDQFVLDKSKEKFGE